MQLFQQPHPLFTNKTAGVFFNLEWDFNRQNPDYSHAINADKIDGHDIRINSIEIKMCLQCPLYHCTSSSCEFLPPKLVIFQSS